jgi:acetyl esterase/lipase
LKKKFAVAVVGYRVYPDGNVTSQVLDLEAAYDKLSKLYPDLCGQNRQKRDKGVIVIGHSSGAHIGLLMIVQQIKRSVHVEDSAENISFSNNPFVDKFIGMSGPYSISHHFDYEAARGVEELSPMKPACGFSREQFRTNSPAIGLQDFMTSVKDKGAISRLFPRSLLVHGIEDGTVPFTATSECARTLRSCGVTNCEEYYAPRTSHEDTVVQLMLGGRVSRAIADWLSVSSGNEKHLRSKL